MYLSQVFCYSNGTVAHTVAQGNVIKPEIHKTSIRLEKACVWPVGHLCHHGGATCGFSPYRPSEELVCGKRDFSSFFSFLFTSLEWF